ncbi:hypothetical protein NFI96_007944 [Prochilodus magdalenae]|nr:hypothetical protein NFI96_007944 [Prochilodus magdalenae]
MDRRGGNENGEICSADWFPYAGQFQCRVTNLVFEMEGKGEVQYRIDSWDARCPLDGLGQMQPAGPLYSIDCVDGSLSHLHLPHCEIQNDHSTETMEAGAEFVDKHRTELIERVFSVMEIVDCLRSENMITAETYSTIQTTAPSQEQMRILYSVMESGGAAVKVEFYKVLKQKQPFLVDNLEAGSSRA